VRILIDTGLTTPRRVLVVDDDAVIRRILGAMLERGRFLVAYATDGEAAWREIQRHGIDLVITDRSMPNLDGLQLLRRIRATPEYASLPVIMLTGSMQDDEGQEATQEGANAFLTKLLSAGTLLATVERVLHDARLTPSLN
jgi:CheY-like chemotaxis protein